MPCGTGNIRASTEPAQAAIGLDQCGAVLGNTTRAGPGAWGLTPGYFAVSGPTDAGCHRRGPGVGVVGVGWRGAADDVVARGDGGGMVREDGHAVGVGLLRRVDGTGGG